MTSSRVQVNSQAHDRSYIFPPVSKLSSSRFIGICQLNIPRSLTFTIILIYVNEPWTMIELNRKLRWKRVILYDEIRSTCQWHKLMTIKFRINRTSSIYYVSYYCRGKFPY